MFYSAVSRALLFFLCFTKYCTVITITTVITAITRRPEKDTVALELGSAVALVLELADQCNIDLPLALLRKIQLNDRKYPASLVRCSVKRIDESNRIESNYGYRS